MGAKREGKREAAAATTPLRRQYLALKRRYPDAVLFFRLGDFYETFDADAEVASRLLHITLTSREMGKGLRVPMAGVPYHAAEAYIAKLIAAGQRVAVCEQLDGSGRPETALGGPPPDRDKAAGARGTLGAAPAKGMMARDVVRVVTPGTVVEPRMLQAERNNYLCALVASREPSGLPRYGLAYADLTTGEFATTELHGDDATAELSRELDRLQPAECVVPGASGRPAGTASGPPGGIGRAAPDGTALGPEPLPGGLSRAGGDEPATPEEVVAAGRNLTRLDAWRFELETAQEAVCRLFGVTSLAGYGCAHLPLATRAAGALVAYVEQTHRQLLALLDGLRTYEPGHYVRLDGFTRRNLELVEERLDPRRAGDSAPRPTLLSVLDDTCTPMGGRLLRRWLGQPLLDGEALRQRHDAVEALAGDGVLRGQVRATLRRVSDVERLTNRVRQGSALPRDLLALRLSLLAAGELRELAAQPALRPVLEGVDPCPDVAGLIERAVYSAPADGARPTKLGSWEEERLIRPGYSQELDDLVQASADARAWIAGLEAAERERTGIRGLKVGFNKVFGYYLHVSHAYRGEVPAHYIRRQTLTDGERYITPELKEYENTVLHAAERIAELERTLFAQLQRQIAAGASRLQATAAALAQLDVLAGFAEVAVTRGYVRPVLDDGDEIVVEAGRHPVVEVALAAATAQVGQPAAFVPNDCRLGAGGDQIAILTGPNMAGKSTYLRSVALIVLLAQAGSFVPAAAARIGMVDRIFTRVGAHDDLAAGQSTFMVEMVETASILRHATNRSLVILDEIGRGTSTYDGVAIAQAVVEYLHGATIDAPPGDRPGDRRAGPPDGAAGSQPPVPGAATAPGACGPRTLFATHYHELAELEQALPRVCNYRMDVLEEGDRVVFLHRVVRGSADRSYGIHVARLAGVPRPVTSRAEEVLAGLEATRGSALAAPRPARKPGNGVAKPSPLQLSMFGHDHPLVDELRALDVLSMTPLQALNRLAEMVERARRDGPIPAGKGPGR